MSCQRAFFDALADRMTRAHWEAEWDAQVGNGVFFHSRWLPSLDKRKQITIETDPSPKATTNTTEKATPPIAVIMRQQRAHSPKCKAPHEGLTKGCKQNKKPHAFRSQIKTAIQNPTIYNQNS